MRLKNKAAQALGRLGKGVKKTLSKVERKRRSLQMAEARKTRWLDYLRGRDQ